MGASPAAMRSPSVGVCSSTALRDPGHCTRVAETRDAARTMACRNQANWPLTKTQIEPKWLGLAGTHEHSTRPRQTHGAAAPDPGAPGAAHPRAPADAGHEAAGHAR